MSCLQCDAVRFSQSHLNKGKAESNCSSWAEIVVDSGPLTLRDGAFDQKRHDVACTGTLVDVSYGPLAEVENSVLKSPT